LYRTADGPEAVAAAVGVAAAAGRAAVEVVEAMGALSNRVAGRADTGLEVSSSGAVVGRQGTEAGRRGLARVPGHKDISKLVGHRSEFAFCCAVLCFDAVGWAAGGASGL